mgnify:FL=1
MFEQFEIENGLIIGNRNSMEMKVERMVSNIFTSEGRNNMRLIEVILDDKNLNEAVKRVKRNKGIAGVDKMTVYEIDTYFQNNKERIKKEILEKKYRLQPIATGELKLPISGYVHMMKAFERMVCEAAVTGNRDLAVTALNMDLLCQIDHDANIVIDELIEAHKDYLPQFNQS